MVVTYMMKIEHALEKAVFASLPICTPPGSFALMMRRLRPNAPSKSRFYMVKKLLSDIAKRVTL